MARLSLKDVAEAKASVNCANKSHVVDQKPSELPMARVNPL